MGIYKPKDIKLSVNVYRQTIYAIKDYEALEERAEELIHEKKYEEVPVKNKMPNSPVEKISENRERIVARIKAINKAFNTVPAEYQAMLWDNIAEGKAMKMIEGVSPATLKRYRKRVITEAAHNLELIDDIEYERLTK